jgi:hypothetical protein
MKKFIWFLLISILILSLMGMTQRPANLLHGGYNHKWGKVNWYKNIIDGSDSTYAFGATIAVVRGASDTLHSCTYSVWNWQSVQVHLSGGSTNRIQIEILKANLASNTRSNIPDSLFATHAWLSVGTGYANNKISPSAADSITAEGQYLPIRMFLDGAGVYKFRVISSHNHTGDSNLELRVEARRN